MDPREKDLSPHAISKIHRLHAQRRHDPVRHARSDARRGCAARIRPASRRCAGLTAKLDLPPLQPVPGDHVLTKTFYLLQDFPGRWDGGKVWVEALPPPDPDAGPEPARGGDGVSPVIIGSNDWAAAWAVDDKGRPLVGVLARRRRAARTGRALRHQCRDVCADRQLQDRRRSCARSARAPGPQPMKNLTQSRRAAEENNVHAEARCRGDYIIASTVETCRDVAGARMRADEAFTIARVDKYIRDCADPPSAALRLCVNPLLFLRRVPAPPRESLAQVPR